MYGWVVDNIVTIVGVRFSRAPRVVWFQESDHGGVLFEEVDDNDKFEVVEVVENGGYLNVKFKNEEKQLFKW